MEKMVRKASDNKYLHKDFHIGLNFGIGYLAKLHGDQAVVDYLSEYASVSHRPLKDAVLEYGLVALEDYFRKLYEMEDAVDDIKFERSENELRIFIEKCPAITHIRGYGNEIVPMFIETTRTVNKGIVRDTPYAFELLSFDIDTGKSEQRFYKKEAAK